MVHLSKIYTRSGDDGSTGLGDGSRVPKHALRIESYGTVDETSSVIGLVRTQELAEPLDERLEAVQNDLFDLGADLCVPGRGGDGLRVEESYVTRLEAWIDEANDPLEPLSSFVLPGGTPAAAWLHLARTVCRRAERCVEALLAEEGEDRVNPIAMRYLNRLSDLLFVYGRVANENGAKDVLWRPGGGDGA
ncbi:MAG TPA: cob(I)yrinic acid a,c-diamide adenosyltransferase [Planctomycetes bacterium]|nr:cob(I)yrinic acid a,c-diamide adenosyltransferase [Planctomycetota bacterium]